MRRLIPIGLFMALAALLIVGLINAPDKERIPSPLIGKAVPAFALPLLEDTATTIRASDLQGQPYLLNVWASWCPGCRLEHQQITHIANLGLLPVYGLNYKDAAEDAGRWLARYGNPYRANLQDLAGQVAIDLGVYGAPETFLVDHHGIIRHKFIGPIRPIDWEEEIKPVVETVLQEARLQ